MTVTTYMPRADSLADKVCQFFMRLPDEELLTREVAEKWGLETKNVGNNLARAVEAEYLALDGTVYSAGPCIALFKAALAHQPKSAGGDLEEAPEPRRHATTPRVDKRNGPFWVDIKTVPIDTDVPMPARGGACPRLDAAVRRPAGGLLLRAARRREVRHRHGHKGLQGRHGQGVGMPQGERRHSCVEG